MRFLFDVISSITLVYWDFAHVFQDQKKFFNFSLTNLLGHAVDVHCRNARQLQGMEIDSLVWTNQWSKTGLEGIEIKVCTLENAPAQQLYMEGVDEQEIIRRTSHCSKKAARKFKNLFLWWQNPCRKESAKTTWKMTATCLVTQQNIALFWFWHK